MAPEDPFPKSLSPADKESFLDFGMSFMISGILAATFKTLNAPIERIKLILQTQTSSEQVGTTGRAPYKGFVNALVRIPKEQGFLSLWRGNFTNLCRYFPTQSINFSLYEVYYKGLIGSFKPETNVQRDALAFLAGGTVGATSCMAVYPLNFCTTRISVDVGDGQKIKREFFSLPDCLWKVYRADGIRGFYQGLTCAIAGMFLYRATYFGVYTTGKRVYLNDYSFDPTSHKVNAPFLVSLAFAQLATISSSVLAYPLDTMSRHLMLRSGQGRTQYLTIRAVARKILQQEGAAGLYRGIYTNLLTTASGSLILVTYDLVKGYYERVIEARREHAAEEFRRKGG